MSKALLKQSAELPQELFTSEKLEEGGVNPNFQFFENPGQYEILLPIPNCPKHLTYLAIKNGIVKVIAKVNHSVPEEETSFKRETYQYHLNTEEGDFSLRYRIEHIIEDGYCFNSFYHKKAIPLNVDFEALQFHYSQNHIKIVLPKLNLD